MTEIHGSCDPAFESVRGLLQQQLAQGNEVGASLCVNIDGQNVVDLWGGHADAEKSKPWEKNTLTGIFSSTKAVVSIAAHILIDRGQLDPNERVATYWPEFAANGKEDIKVSHILSHSSGLPAWDGGDHARRDAGPGSQSAYQTSTYGHLVGELVRRISGKSLTQFIADEIADPLGADFHLGISEEDWPRTADIVPFPAEYAAAFNFDPESFLGKSAAGSALLPLLPNDPKFRKAENGSWGGFSNARALARIGSIVSLDGTVDGKKYLSPETLDAVMKEQIQGNDPILFVYMRYALGFGLPPGKDFRSVPEGDGICFWGGWGGSLLVMDRRRRMTIAYMMNKMEFRTIGCARAEEYVQDIYKNFDAKK
ncbi:beta-lactamase [Penicillium chermesinum]|uniref:Beta-lactamase n=1 Tax=Penicillium chermesinum TaxID=63820 RepID=A0A9W9P653_9EURO|nr:beta-lactamase [Penicillium chermesinum]KAJ5238335.1 beta-lactamase [Penicillium chermesinum]